MDGIYVCTTLTPCVASFVIYYTSTHSATMELSDTAMKQIENLITKMFDEKFTNVNNNFTKIINSSIASLEEKLVKVVEEKVDKVLEELSVTKAKLADLETKYDQLENQQGTIHEGTQQQISYVQEKQMALTWKADQQEQYSRVNAVRIHNVPVVGESEDTTDLALKVFSDMGVPLNREAIDVSHRVKGGGVSKSSPDAIILKFCRREDKSKVMKGKKDLKNSAHYKDVVIEEDLTTMRRKLVSVLKGSGHSSRRVWTIDGKVCAREQVGDEGRERSIAVQTFQDFLKLKFDENKCSFIGLYSM